MSKPGPKEEDIEKLSCDSCGWVIKVDEVYAEKDGEVLCEHCLDVLGKLQAEPH